MPCWYKGYTLHFDTVWGEKDAGFHRITQINIVVDITATSKYSSLDFSKIYTYVPTAMIEKICNLKQNQPVQRATNISDLNVHGANRLLFILYILYKITNYLKKLSFSE